MSLVSDTDSVDTGAMTFTGIEDLTIAVSGSASDFDATIGTGITGTSLNNITVTSSGYGASSDTTDIVLGTVNDAGSDSMLSFDASGANTGVSVTLADMSAGSTVTGSGFIDLVVLTGSAANVIASGGAGGDTLTAAAAGSTLNGDAGADTLNGAAGADVINGGAGADTIDAGAGADTITLGAGADVYSHDGTVATDGSDTITDFTGGAGGDVVDFQTADVTVGSSGFTATAFSTKAAANLTNTFGGLLVIDNGGVAATSAAGLTAANVETYLGDMDSGTGGTQALAAHHANDDFYLVVSDGTDAALWAIIGSTDGADTTINDGDLNLVATLSGVGDTGVLTAANFADFI
jgi:Ca2+-binding RTX toxin-like protein